MKAVYKNEMRGYFTTMIGYVFIALIVLFAGIFASYFAFKHADTHFEYVPVNMGFVLIIAVPILTMRVFSEERRQKTEALLYSLPVTTAEIVAGKYLALLSILAISLLFVCVIPPVIGLFGVVNLGVAYASIGGFFLLGAAFLAVGMFISSLTEMQVLSAVLSMLVIGLNYFLGILAPYVNTGADLSFYVLLLLALLFGAFAGWLVKNRVAGAIVAGAGLMAVGISYVVNKNAFTGLLMKALRSVALFDRFEGIVYTVVDLRDYLFFISVAVLFAFLTVQSLEKRRWS